MTELKAHLEKMTQPYKQLILDLIQEKEMKAAIFFYVAAARLVLGKPILLICPTKHISSTSTPYYTFTEEYCIPEDKNVTIQDLKYI